MMQDFLFIMLVNFVLGTNFSMYDPAGNNLYSVPNWFFNHPVLGWERRRTSGSISYGCIRDIDKDSIWCVTDSDFNCGVLRGDHTKWVIQIDHDTEWMCYPSSCSASDIQYLYSTQMEWTNSSAKYCTLECPAIEFDINGTSEDGQSMSISGMVNYADLSYDCAGAAAVTEITTCEESGACPSDAIGLTTCTITFEDRRIFAHLNRTWKYNGDICLPHECTDDTNLEKMEDFLYAYLTYLESVDGVILTAVEIRNGYLVDFSCPVRNETNETSNGVDTPDGDDTPHKDEDTSSHKYSKYVLMFGISSAVLLALCFIAMCFLRARRGGVVMTPIIAVEFHNRETVAVVRPESCHCNRVETEIIEVDSSRASPLDYASPIQTNEGMQSGERAHL